MFRSVGSKICMLTVHMWNATSPSKDIASTPLYVHLKSQSIPERNVYQLEGQAVFYELSTVMSTLAGVQFSPGLLLASQQYKNLQSVPFVAGGHPLFRKKFSNGE